MHTQPAMVRTCGTYATSFLDDEARGYVGSAEKPDSFLDPDAIARNYLHLVRQHRSAWTFELELRPWLERF